MPESILNCNNSDKENCGYKCELRINDSFITGIDVLFCPIAGSECNWEYNEEKNTRDNTQE